MEQKRVRMPKEMVEQINQVAADLALLLDDSIMNFSAALRHLVTLGLKARNGHNGDPQNGNPPSVLHR